MGHYNSFVVRVWSGGSAPLRGTIEHVTSRSSRVFADPAAVIEFILAHLGPPSHDLEGPPGDGPMTTGDRDDI
jgi:hypothetical protein